MDFTLVFQPDRWELHATDWGVGASGSLINFESMLDAL